MNRLTLEPQFVGQRGPEAGLRLMEIALSHCGGGTRPIAQLLLSLFDAEIARVDGYALCRRIDDEYFEDVLVLMRWFRTALGAMDFHRIFGPRGGELMRELARRHGFLPEQELAEAQLPS